MNRPFTSTTQSQESSNVPLAALVDFAGTKDKVLMEGFIDMHFQDSATSCRRIQSVSVRNDSFIQAGCLSVRGWPQANESWRQSKCQSSGSHG